MDCPYRKSVLNKKGKITVLCDRLSTNLANMDWIPHRSDLDEFGISKLKFPRDCPIKDDPVKEEPESCPPEPDPKEYIAMLYRRYRKLAEEGKFDDAQKLFQEASKIQFGLMIESIKERLKEKR